jgi:ABC-type phosphate/phosphonate transport system substrate-binding protein
VPADSKITSVADLEGEAIALPRLSREHCHLFLARRCVKPGYCPKKFFSQIAAPDDVEEALEDMLDGKYAAAVVDGLALEGYLEMKPGRASRLKTLLLSEPFPCGVVAYQSGAVSEEWIARFRDGMLAARSSRRGQQLLQMCRITSFEKPPANYDRMLQDIARAYPPPTK